MTQNTLPDLNNLLFETLERIQDEDITGEMLDNEIKRAKAITEISETILSNADIMLKAESMRIESGYRSETAKQMLKITG